jgi:hypothetical protein
MVTFALFILFFSIESKDERDSAFSLDTFSDKMFRITTGGSFVLLVLSTVLGIFQTVMKTVRLDVTQWLICTAVALSVVVAAEIRKAARRRPAAQAGQPEPPLSVSAGLGTGSLRGGRAWKPGNRAGPRWAAGCCAPRTCVRTGRRGSWRTFSRASFSMPRR